MGEARTRRAHKMIWHHTSQLWTNELWMSGYIEPEGARIQPYSHPYTDLMVAKDPLARRPMIDFPALSWFTTKVSIPGVLLRTSLIVAGPDGTTETKRLTPDVANVLALRRVALGFKVADIPVVPWPDHPGFDTEEGRDLNESAIEVGDDPRDWYVSEVPIDILAAAEIRVSRSIQKPKLERSDTYLAHVKNMVSVCRTTPGVYIPPSWLDAQQIREAGRRSAVPVMWGDGTPFTK